MYYCLSINSAIFGLSMKKMNLNCAWWSAPLKRPRSDSTLRLSRGCGHPKVGNLSLFFYQNNSVLCQPNHRKTHQDICFRDPPRGPDGLGAQNWLAAVCCGGFVGHSRYSAVPSNRTADLPSCSQTLWLSFHVFLNAKYKYKYKAAYKTNLKNSRCSAVPSTRTFPAPSLSFSFWFSWARHQKKTFVFFRALPEPRIT